MKILEQVKATALVRVYAFLKIKLLWWVQPVVLENGPERTVLRIPLTRRTRNHLKTMYFGALAMGAEAAVALKAIQAIQESKKPVDFVFKDFHAEFLKRAEGNVHFTCDQGLAVAELVRKCIESGQRETETFRSYATVPAVDANEIVAEFRVTLSLKLRQKRS